MREKTPRMILNFPYSNLNYTHSIHELDQRPNNSFTLEECIRTPSKVFLAPFCNCGLYIFNL